MTAIRTLAPAACAKPLIAVIASLLAKEAVVRPARGDQLPDQPLGGKVGFADQIGGGRLRSDLAGPPRAVPIQQEPAGAARGLGGKRAQLLRIDPSCHRQLTQTPAAAAPPSGVPLPAGRRRQAGDPPAPAAQPIGPPWGRLPRPGRPAPNRPVGR